MIILVDMDDVLADFDGGFLIKWREKYPDEFFIPMSERQKFYMRDEYPPELIDKMTGLFTQKGFVSNLPLIEGGIEAVNNIKDKGHDVFICTSPMRQYQNCVAEKYEWVEKNMGFDWTTRIILSRDKTLIQGNILIDDKPEVTGAGVPVWEHVIYNKSYNAHVNGQRRITWQNYQKVLKELYK